jgi:hypothetical protein
MADYTQAQIEAHARQQMTKMPQFLLNGIDPNKVKFVRAGAAKGFNNEDAVASINTADPYTVNIHDVDRFMQPGAASQTMAHEFSHVQQSRKAGGMSAFAPLPRAGIDPYQYDENNVGGRHASKYNPEQLATIAQHYTADMNNPNLSDADLKASIAKYQPTMSQFANMRDANISNDQSGQSMTIPYVTPGTMNTTPNAPAPPAIMSGLPVATIAPQTSQPAAQGVPQGGSQGQPQSDPFAGIAEDNAVAADPFAGIAEDAPHPTYMQGVNRSAGEVLKGMGKMALGAIASDPSVASISPVAHVQQLADNNELNQDLQSNNPAQTVGKAAAAGIALGRTGGFDPIENLVSLAKKGYGNVTGSTAVDALHSSLGNTLQKVAAEAGVDVKPTDNIRKVIPNVADAIEAKAKEKMDALDNAWQGLKVTARGAGGKFMTGTTEELGLPDSITGFDDQIGKLQKTLQTQSGANNIEARAATQAKIKELTNAKSQILRSLDKQDLGTAHDEALKLQDQAEELRNLRDAHNRATKGMPGQTNPKKFGEELEPLYNSGQLHTALGPDNAEKLMSDTAATARTFGRTQTVQKVGKAAAKTALRAAGYGLGADLLK